MFCFFSCWKFEISSVFNFFFVSRVSRLVEESKMLWGFKNRNEGAHIFFRLDGLVFILILSTLLHSRQFHQFSAPFELLNLNFIQFLEGLEVFLYIFNFKIFYKTRLIFYWIKRGQNYGKHFIHSENKNPFQIVQTPNIGKLFLNSGYN